MREFIFEMKKILIFQKGLWFIIFLMILKMIGLLLTDDGAALQENKSDYLFYLEPIKGALTEKTQRFLREESEKISGAKIELENLYLAYYNSVLNKQAMSKSELDYMTQSFEGQIEKEGGFLILYDQYMYIRENPDNRYFLYTDGWNALLAHERLDLPLFLLLLLLITPIFCQEYESKMDAILLSSKKGRANLVGKKILLAFGMVVILSLFFSFLDYAFFSLHYGLEDGHYPLQSLEYYHSSIKNLSLLEAYIGMSFFRIIGHLFLAVIIMFASVYTKKTVLTLFFGSAVVLIPYFGLAARWVAYILPLPLSFMIGSGFFKGDELAESADGMSEIIVYRSVSELETAIMIALLFVISYVIILLVFKKYINYQIRRRKQVNP